MSEEILQEHLKRWEPFKIEFLDLKDNLYKLDSSIEYVTEDYMIIIAPKFENERYDLPVNSEVSVVFYRNDGMLYGQTTILGKQAGFDSKLKVSKPYNISLIERRGAKRFRLKLKLEIEYYLNRNSLNKKVLNEVTHDISATGLSYISEMPFGKYHNIKCYIYLDNNFSNPIKVNCSYVYSRKKQIKNGVMYHNAFQYTKISRDDLFRLQQKCYRKSCR